MDPLKTINNFFKKLERKGWVKRTPGLFTDYDNQYPFFKELEQNHEVIRKECEQLLGHESELHYMQGVAGKQTTGGIYTGVQWKNFMFKAGAFIEENCQLCPETADMLKRVPRIKQAFFSILYPGQHIAVHKGYYHGFLRYHLGVIIPNNNEDKSCWLRVHDDLMDNETYHKPAIEKAEKYYWKNGAGVMFNDNYLHDACNESDGIRVVLFIDVVRRFPFWIDWFNALILNIGYKTKKVKAVAEKAKVKIQDREKVAS